MSGPTQVNGLAGVKFLPASDNNSVCLMLLDTKGNEAGFLINAEGLNALLLPALGLATRWADSPDLQVESWSGPKNALPATHVELTKGRNPTEIALRVFVGKIELSFLVPLDDVVHAVAWLAQNIDPSSGSPAH